MKVPKGWTAERDAFWNDPDNVQRFEDREPDHRLQTWVENFEGDRATTRVLDLGCAAGRNSVFLAENGFDLLACDLAQAMVDRTRDRLSGHIDPHELERRVQRSSMTDLGFVETGSLDWVVALGVYHQAASDEEWDLALRETARVLRPGGRLLVANFAPGSGPVDKPPARVPGTRFSHTGLAQGTTCLLDLEEQDAEFARFGLLPNVPSVVVRREEGGRRRVTVNADYTKASACP